MKWVKFICGAVAAALYGALFVFYTYGVNIEHPQTTLLGNVLSLMVCLSLMGSSFLCAAYAIYHRPFSIWLSDRTRRRTDI